MVPDKGFDECSYGFRYNEQCTCQILKNFTLDPGESVVGGRKSGVIMSTE